MTFRHPKKHTCFVSVSISNLRSSSGQFLTSRIVKMFTLEKLDDHLAQERPLSGSGDRYRSIHHNRKDKGSKQVGLYATDLQSRIMYAMKIWENIKTARPIVKYASICIERFTAECLKCAQTWITQFYLKITPCLPLLPSRRTSPLFGWYSFYQCS